MAVVLAPMAESETDGLPGPRQRARRGCPRRPWLPLLLLVTAIPIPNAAASGESHGALDRVRANAEQRLVPHRAAVLAACRVDLPMTVDWASFERAKDAARQGDHGLVAWSCSRVHDTLVAFCADPARRDAVARKLKHLRCRSGRDGDAWLLRDGELVVEIRGAGAFSVEGINPLARWLETVL